MADLGITGLKTEVDVQIYTNHAQAITGAIMNDTLIDTIDTLKNGGNLDAKSVDTAQLADGAVEALQINTGAVTEAKIGTGAVTEAKIGAKAVTNTKIGDKAVDTLQLADNAVKALQINTGAVETAKIKDLAVTVDKIATGAVTHAKIGVNAVDGDNIQDSSITELKIYEGSINEGHLQMNCVTEEKIATDAVTEAKIEASAVTNTKIASGAVTEAKIGSGAVTTSKLAAKNVTSEKLADDAIVRTFAGAVLLNPFAANKSPRRIGDFAINIASGEIWQSTDITNVPASWNRISAGYYNGQIITNWNTNILSGDITSYGSATGAPTSAESFYGHHINSNVGTANAVQWAIGDTTLKMYFRAKTASTWGAWSTGITATELGYLSGVTSNIQSQIDGIETNIAPEWVASTPYAWYDFVMHNNLLYMCISPNSDATWIEGKWLVKDVGKILTSNYQDSDAISSHLSETATALDTTVDNFAAPWRSNFPYAIGELVIREYQLYRCKTANSDSVWAASKWARVSIRGEINPQLFTGAAFLNPFNAVPSLTPRRIGDFAINTASGEIWQATATTNAAASWELQPSVAYVEVVKENVDSINVDNLGDVRAKSIDMDELLKVCGFPMYIISATAPNVSPDFISQHWIDTVAKKVYIAVGVSSAADFVVLN